jgi:hypothetical protein
MPVRSLMHIKCAVFMTPKKKAFYWALMLHCVGPGSNHFKRMGIGIMWPEPSGAMQKYYIE